MKPPDDPLEEWVYVLKGGRRLGPFTVEDLLDGLESGDFSEEDICLREGETDCERLRDLLDWEENGEEDQDDEEVRNEEDDEEEVVEDEEEEDFEDEDDEDFEDPLVVKKSQPEPDRILYAGHPSVLTYPLSLLALVGGLVGGIWLHRLNPVLALACFGLGLGGLARLGLMRFTHDYRVRLRRIETVTGFLARSSKEVRITDLRSINVTCRGLAGMMGIGTIDFLTTGDEPEISFQNVWRARRIKGIVRRLQDAV